MRPIFAAVSRDDPADVGEVGDVAADHLRLAAGGGDVRAMTAAAASRLAL